MGEGVTDTWAGQCVENSDVKVQNVVKDSSADSQSTCNRLFIQLFQRFAEHPHFLERAQRVDHPVARKGFALLADQAGHRLDAHLQQNLVSQPPLHHEQSQERISLRPDEPEMHQFDDPRRPVVQHAVVSHRSRGWANTNDRQVATALVTVDLQDRIASVSRKPRDFGTYAEF